MSESGAGETKVDGKAHEEGDEICRRNSLYLLPSGEPVCHLRHQVSPDRKSLYIGEAEESMGARRFSLEVRSPDT